MTEAETRRLAASGAVAGLCPTTEANLGDGLFPLKAYLDAGGVLGIGSDSHISVSPVEELRWLEYGQRLATQRRCIAVEAQSPSVGDTLLHGVQASAANATGFADARDTVTLDPRAPLLAGATSADIADRWIFAGNRNLVRGVRVAGRQVVSDGRHHARDAIEHEYRQAMTRLLA